MAMTQLILNSREDPVILPEASRERYSAAPVPLSEEVEMISGRLVRELREHREEYLYYRTDHHWTTLGAYYAFCKAEQVMGLETIGEPEFCELAGNFEGTL